MDTRAESDPDAARIPTGSFDDIELRGVTNVEVDANRHPVHPLAKAQARNLLLRYIRTPLPRARALRAAVWAHSRQLDILYGIMGLEPRCLDGL